MCVGGGGGRGGGSVEQPSLTQNFIFMAKKKIGIMFLPKIFTFLTLYKGKSISNQPIPFPFDRDTQDFHALFQYMF